MLNGDNPVVTFHTNQGDFAIELFADTQPITVTNFLKYINDGDFANSIIHRSAKSQDGDPFVIQGGGFKTTTSTFTSVSQFTPVPTDPTIQNEPGISNLRGTVAMAKGSDPNSASSQFFVNLGDNSFLDTPANGAFTVFGRVRAADLTRVIDAIAALPRFQITTGAPFNELPLATGNQLVVVTSVDVNGTAQGTAYKDLNQDGVHDVGEVGLAGLTVFSDVDNDGVLDAAEISTTTDAQGNYAFSLPPGTHTIRQIPANSLIDAAALSHSVVVFSSQVASGVDFNNFSELFASFTVVATHQDGRAITAADPLLVGDNFKVQVFVEDPQPGVLDSASRETTGVTVAGLDLFYDAAKAEFRTPAPSSPVFTNPSNIDLTFGDLYFSDLARPTVGESDNGHIDEVFTSFDFDLSSFNLGPGDGKFLLFSVNMQATAAGTLTFTTGAAELQHHITVQTTGANGQFGALYDPTEEEVLFGTSQVNIVSRLAAQNDTFNVRQDSDAVLLDVLQNDVKNTNATLVITGVGVLSSGSAQVVDVPGVGQRISYQPANGFTGDQSFTYTLRELVNGEFAEGSVTGEVTVKVTASSVLAVDDTTTTPEDTAKFIDVLADVLVNDVDLDNTPPSNVGLAVTGVTQGAHGTVELFTSGVNAGKLRYTPADNFSGVDVFTYTVSDGNDQPSTANVTVTVASVNDNPTLANDERSTIEGSIAVSLDVLANDSFAPDANETLTITEVGAPSRGGQASIEQGRQHLLYTPLTNFFGTETITYTVSDGNGGTETATVTVTVANVNDAPTAGGDSFTFSKNSGPHTFNVRANDSFLPDPTETLEVFEVTQITTNGVVTIAEGGTGILYTPNTDFVGTDTFTYKIKDGNGGEDTATVTVTVLAFLPSSLKGFVFVDANGNGVRETSEDPLAGVAITLIGAGLAGDVNLTLDTTPDGSYEFNGLAPGDYTIIQPQQPSFLLDGRDTPGTQGGDGSVNDRIVINDLAENTQGQGNNFGELGPEARYLTLPDFYLRGSRNTIWVALSETNEELWLSRSGDWKNVANVQAEFNADRSQVRLQITDANQQLLQTTIPVSDLRHLRIAGTTGNDTLVKISGSRASFPFTLVTAAPAASGEGESPSTAARVETAAAASANLASEVNSSGSAPALAEGEAVSSFAAALAASAAAPSASAAIAAPTDSSAAAGNTSAALSAAPAVASSLVETPLSSVSLAAFSTPAAASLFSPLTVSATISTPDAGLDFASPPAAPLASSSSDEIGASAKAPAALDMWIDAIFGSHPEQSLLSPSDEEEPLAKVNVEPSDYEAAVDAVLQQGLWIEM